MEIVLPPLSVRVFDHLSSRGIVFLISMATKMTAAFPLSSPKALGWFYSPHLVGIVLRLQVGPLSLFLVRF